MKINHQAFQAILTFLLISWFSEAAITKAKVEMLTNWNEKVMQYAVEEDGLLTLKGLRTESMMHLAVHDALNAIIRKYEPYAYQELHPTASPLAASAQAAYVVVSNQYPKKETELKKELMRWLAQVSDGKAKNAGVELGKSCAMAVMAKRENDKWNGESEYSWHPMAPGVYAEFNEHSGTPKGFVFGSGWAAAEPFMLTSQDQFRVPPPPEISSAAYTKAYNEVKEVGSADSKTRTADQAHLAMWWKDFVENSHNRLARELVIKEQLDLWEAARLFALMNMSIYDAYVSVFENKFHYNHWRPYTAIRWAENDENPNTIPDPEWDNLHKHTYAFPSYPSAHGAASGAAMTVLANTLGKGDKYAFTMRTDSVDKAGPFSGKIKTDPPTRSFNSFSEAAREASNSRIYLGIHFRYDSDEGYKLGKQIGDYACQNFLRRQT